MSSIAVITARGGSKRIPGKNIKEFCGLPIIAYSIRAALSAGIFDDVMVSTDSLEIKRVAEVYGASVPFLRSEENSNDFATTADVMKEVIECYRSMGKLFSSFACIYPTAPFITGDRLVDAFGLLNDADAVLSVVRYSFPPQRALVIREQNISFLHPEYERTRSQDLEPIYHDCGQFYICKVAPFLEHNSLILPETKPYVLQEEEVQDIDSMSDWIIAEAKYRALHKKNES